jgi:excisionase family DNA binding protein
MKQSVTPMSYTLGTAAKATGKSKPTIQRAIKSGRISAVRKPDGSYEIEPAELHRVFPPLHDTGKAASDDTGHMQPPVTSYEPPLQAELTSLRERLSTLEIERGREREQLLDQIADLRSRLDAEAEERRRLTALLTDQRQREEPVRRRSWWPWSRERR